MAVSIPDIPLKAVGGMANIRTELERLAESTGTEVKARAGLWYYNRDPIMEGEYGGFPFKVLYQRHVAGWTGMFSISSVSLILDLPKPGKYTLKMQNKLGMRFNFYQEVKPKDPSPATDMPPEVLDEVVPTELRDFLQNSGLDYVFTIAPERIAVTVYRAYQHDFYLYLLQEMARIAATLSRLE